LLGGVLDLLIEQTFVFIFEGLKSLVTIMGVAQQMPIVTSFVGLSGTGQLSQLLRKFYFGEQVDTLVLDVVAIHELIGNPDSWPLEVFDERLSRVYLGKVGVEGGHVLLVVLFHLVQFLFANVVLTQSEVVFIPCFQRHHHLRSFGCSFESWEFDSVGVLIQTIHDFVDLLKLMDHNLVVYTCHCQCLLS
jgi:hypothetical protein